MGDRNTLSGEQEMGVIDSDRGFEWDFNDGCPTLKTGRYVKGFAVTLKNGANIWSFSSVH